MKKSIFGILCMLGVSMSTYGGQIFAPIDLSQCEITCPVWVSDPEPCEVCETCETCATPPENTNERFVMPTERGQYFARGPEDAISEWGALIFTNSVADKFCAEMQPEALKMPHSRVNNFTAAEENGSDVQFPFSAFEAYDASEVAKGNSSLFITAGGKRVEFYLGSGRYLVDIGDERMVRFWVDYVRDTLLRDGCENIWVAIDNGSWRRSVGSPSSGWDMPYAQSDQEYMDDVKFFFRKVKEIAPDIKVAVNLGTPADWDQLPELFADVDGLILETWPEKTASKTREYFKLALWYAEQNRVSIFRTRTSDGASDDLFNAYMLYLVSRGENSFFGPRYQNESDEISEIYYVDHREKLGWHVASPIEVQSNVWMREHEGGIVFVNLSDSTVTLDVPDGYVIRSGGSLTLRSLEGDYVVRN